MTLLSLLFALLMEQVHPLKHDSWVLRAQEQWAHFISKQLDTGHEKHTGLIWGLCVGLPAVFVLVIYWLLWTFLGWILAGSWCVLVLYATLGFRQFSHHFTDIKDGLLKRERRTSLEKSWPSGRASIPLSWIKMKSPVWSSSIPSWPPISMYLVSLFWFSMGAALGLVSAGAAIYRLSHCCRFANRVTRPSDGLRGKRRGSVPVCVKAQSAWSKGGLAFLQG
jgi:adenosylcobinamide-phosphate synthase